VIRDQTTGRVAGLLGLRHSIHRPDEWEMAYNLLPAYRGKRLIKEAFGAALEGWIKWTGMRVLEAVRHGLTFSSFGFCSVSLNV
jgi:RimJ/RimL family protein N-acetyltransferase